MPKTITVKSGDTLSQILKDAGISSYKSSSTWQTVASASGLASYNKIKAGNTITIPDALLGISTPSTKATATTTPQSTVSIAPPEAGTTAELTQYLNEQQDKLAQLENYDALDVSGQEVSNVLTGDKLGMTGEAPVAPKYEETFNKLKTDMGLDTIESGINEYKQLIREQENLLVQQKSSERNKTVGMGVIEGRVDKATRDRQEQISWLSSNVSYLTDVANSAYNYINMTMNFKQMDYNTAKESYDTEFNRRMSIYTMLKGEKKDERDFQLNLMQQQQATASTQLSMYADMITSGSMTWDSLSADQKLSISKLEVQAGLPVGFTSKIKIPKNSTTLSVSNRTDPSGNIYADILYIDPATGATEVTHQLLGKAKVASSGGSSSSQTVAQKAEAEFRKALSNPSVTIVSNSTQERELRDMGKMQGSDWLTREQFASRLASQFGMPLETVKAFVYSTYSD